MSEISDYVHSPSLIERLLRKWGWVKKKFKDRLPKRYVKIPTIFTSLPDTQFPKELEILSRDLLTLFDKDNYMTILDIREEEKKPLGYRSYIVSGPVMHSNFTENNIIVTFPLLNYPDPIDYIVGKYVVVKEGEINLLREVVAVFPKDVSDQDFYKICADSLKSILKYSSNLDLTIENIKIEYGIEKSYNPDLPVVLAIGVGLTSFWCINLENISEIVCWKYIGTVSTRN